MASALPESRDELLRELEQLTGHSFHSREDVHKFIAEMDARSAARQKRSASDWRAAKSTTLLVLLVLAFVQFYIVDALLQTASLREMTFFVPVKTEQRS